MDACNVTFLRCAVCSFSIATGVFLGLAVAAYASRKDHRFIESPEELLNDDEVRKMEVRKFNSAWLDELAELHAREDVPSLDSIEWECPVYPSPYGEVGIQWSPEKETFEYWSDESHVPFPTLDALARRYTLAHEAVGICKDSRAEFRKARDKFKREKTEAMRAALDAEEEARPSIFAPLKAARRPGRRKISMLMEKNRFSHRGTLEEHKLRVADKIKADCSFRPISFSQYKSGACKD